MKFKKIRKNIYDKYYKTKEIKKKYIHTHNVHK